MKPTNQKKYRRRMRFHFRWCLDLSILRESSHDKNISRSHLKGLQFINKNYQRSRLHKACGYSYIKIERSNFFSPNALYSKIEATVFISMILVVFLYSNCTGHLSQYLFSQACAFQSQVINQSFTSTLGSIK